MSFIHELPDWPRLRWDMVRLAGQLADVRHRQGRLLGHMDARGFELRTEASLSTLTADVVKTSAIEGEHLDAGEVRSSIARRLGVEAGGAGPASRDVEAIVEVILDATQDTMSSEAGPQTRRDVVVDREPGKKPGAVRPRLVGSFGTGTFRDVREMGGGVRPGQQSGIL